MKNIRLLSTACCLLFPTVVGAQVPYQRIVNAAAEPGNWLTYSGNYQAYRFSPLREITPQNVSRLKPAWVYQIEARGRFETSPIVVCWSIRSPVRPTTMQRAINGLSRQLLRDI